MWKVDVLTIFPDMFPGPLAYSLLGKALDKGLWGLDAINIRDFATDAHQSVDDTGYGGGPGMIMRPDVLGRALESVEQRKNGRPIIYLSPRGKPLCQKKVKKLAQAPGLILLCGRYEGVDERVLEAHGVEELSIGDYILTGGEIAAHVLIDSCVRLLPGVVHEQESLVDESFEGGLLEYPQYTRPQEWQGRKVPEVLLSGHHAQIRNWRRTVAEKLTEER
ncbi:MAG: tRNA (guanosine(37)-N1)-methyltransferase TrmD, partial [Alphaproteobacteria bacterium]|nr:tRNA (guanosine(37)-N1)-methyltransferase TrmD [Alphaproteobacteria bacterium]